ncbi:ankyrin repeat-containing domain protein [Gautieria morchelliformis]|nr:ankyrin repeat-containing domain protein [Gautieria morchelliformis]
MASLSVHSAAQNNQLSLLRSLLAENPTQLNVADADGRTALHWASTSPGGIEIVQFLLEQRGIEVDKSDDSGWSPLHIAVSAGREGVVRELLGAGAYVNKTNDKGLTSLCVVCFPFNRCQLI